MRTYQPLWIKLRDNGSTVLAASPSLHRRIIKAVRKERNKDLVFRYELGERLLRADIRYEIAGNYIKLYLQYRPDMRVI